jgi:hypothetical protein
MALQQSLEQSQRKATEHESRFGESFVLFHVLTVDEGSQWAARRNSRHGVGIKAVGL